MGEMMGYFDEYDDQYDFEEYTPERESNYEEWDEIDRLHALEKTKDSLHLRAETIVLRMYILYSNTVLSSIQKATIVLNAILTQTQNTLKTHQKKMPAKFL
jgi:hypothetical protein